MSKPKYIRGLIGDHEVVHHIYEMPSGYLVGIPEKAWNDEPHGVWVMDPYDHSPYRIFKLKDSEE